MAEGASRDHLRRREPVERFTYVDDIARGTVAALRPVGFDVIDLGSDRPVALAEVLAHVEYSCARPANVVHRPFHPADVMKTELGADLAGTT